MIRTFFISGKNPMLGGFAIFAVIACTTLALAMVPDVSGPARPGPREWKDASGNVIKRVAADGRSWLYTYDEVGNLVVVVERESDKNGKVGSSSWLNERVHSFGYIGNSGKVSGEIDCRGIETRFDPPRELVQLRGTVLEDHSHRRNHRTSAVSRKFEYDDRGNLMAIRDEPGHYEYDERGNLV